MADSADPGGPIRLLHVDSNQRFADKVAVFVERKDERIEVENATSVEAAVDRVERGDIDCVVAAYDLGERTGIDLLEAVRETHPMLPFVLFTGKGSEQVASEAISMGVSDYLQKDPETDQYALLANRVGNLVDQHRARSGLERHADRQRRVAAYHETLLEITSDPSLSPEATIRRLLDAVREFFEDGNSYLVNINEPLDRYRIVATSGATVEERDTSLSESYCRRMIESDEVFEVYNAVEQGWSGDPAYEKWGFGSYLGKRLLVEGELYGTLCFAADEPRSEPFATEETVFFDLVCSVATQLLERVRRRSQFEALFEHAQDAAFVIDVRPERSFEIRRVSVDCTDGSGTDADSVAGQEPSAVVGGDAGEQVRTQLLECVDGRDAVAFDHAVPNESGDAPWRTVFAPVVEADAVVQVVGTSRRLAGPPQAKSV